MKKHSTRKHALLSASGSSRWLNCPPSARLEEKYPESTSKYAEEGTLAHELAELELQKSFTGYIPWHSYDEQKKMIEESKLYLPEMADYVDTYVSYVLLAAKSNALFIEDKIDLIEFIEEGFGTCDAIIVGDGVLEVIDLKYGKGIRVEAKENSQLMLYGLGAYYKHELTYDIKKIKLTIVQPRLDHISTWEIAPKKLMAWGNKVVKKQAKLAYAGEGDFNPGDHCQWCKAKPRCKALAASNLEIARHDFVDPAELTDKELLEVFEKQSLLVDWVKSVATYLLDKALEGKKWTGFKVVEGRANRKWSDVDKVGKVLSLEGHSEAEIFNTKLKGLGDIEKLVGKDNFTALLGKLVIKPQGAPTLVADTDKRPGMGLAQAKEDFK